MEEGIHVYMRGLREHAAALEQEAQLPCRATLRADLLVDDHGIQQSSPTDSLDQRGVNRANRRTELLPESLCALRELLFDQHIKRGYRYRASERVARKLD